MHTGASHYRILGNERRTFTEESHTEEADSVEHTMLMDVDLPAPLGPSSLHAETLHAFIERLQAQRLRKEEVAHVSQADNAP